MNSKFKAAAAGTGVFTLTALGLTGCTYVTKDQVCFTVSDKERITETDMDGNATSKFLVFTEEGEVFENTDNALRFKFDSSTLQGQLREGNAYEATVSGIRNGPLSLYRNILDITPVEDCSVFNLNH